MIDTVASDKVIDAAFAWLCKRRQGYPPRADVWALRHDWVRQRARIQAELRAGSYRLASVQRIITQAGEVLHVWRAADALVLKALTIVLEQQLPISDRCTHVKGNGGAHGAVAAIRERLSEHRFVARTDVAAYYDSIDHERLLDLLERQVEDGPVMNLLGQYLRYTVEQGGLFADNRAGICRGCSLSPLMGAFFLAQLDGALEQEKVFCVRFMDDIVILASTRWKLRKAVRAMNEVLASLGLKQHPDKTFIGRIERGFEFLGVHFSPEGTRIAAASVERFVQRATRLYEQEPDGVRLGQYCARWAGWAKAEGRDDQGFNARAPPGGRGQQYGRAEARVGDPPKNGKAGPPGRWGAVRRRGGRGRLGGLMGRRWSWLLITEGGGASSSFFQSFSLTNTPFMLLADRQPRELYSLRGAN